VSIIVLFLLALALSMDCFAVAVAVGFSNKDLKKSKILFISVVFGIAHFVMPLLGWFIGNTFKSYIERFDHWIAFFLLFIIGVKMLANSFKKGEERSFSLNKGVVILLLAIATSIDALIVGLSLALFNYHLLVSASIISVTAFVITFIGFVTGRKFGCYCGKNAELFGAIILILIGFKILFEHLNIF